MDVYTRLTADTIADKIADLPEIYSAYVDDYKEEGDYVDFQVVAVLRAGKDFNLRSASKRIKKILNDDKSVMRFGKNVECPRRKYDTIGYFNGQADKVFAGYERNYIMVDFKLLT